jgi:citrate-Mg2+:H+ or citrate-Ca2+:H+ symporter, CitMHS family
VLAALGFATIATFLLAVISKRLSVITALVLIPVIFGFLAGISLKDLSEMMLNGIKQVAPTGILLFFAVLYFSVMLDAGLFDPIISFIVRKVKGDPLKVVLGTAILTMIVHLDGDGTATFMIVVSAFLPIYKALKMKRLVLAGIVALAVGPLHLHYTLSRGRVLLRGLSQHWTPHHRRFLLRTYLLLVPAWFGY